MSAPLCVTCERRPALVFRHVTRAGRHKGTLKLGHSKHHDECLQCHRATRNRVSPKFTRASRPEQRSA